MFDGARAASRPTPRQRRSGAAQTMSSGTRRSSDVSMGRRPSAATRTFLPRRTRKSPDTNGDASDARAMASPGAWERASDTSPKTAYPAANRQRRLLPAGRNGESAPGQGAARRCPTRGRRPRGPRRPGKAETLQEVRREKQPSARELQGRRGRDKRHARAPGVAPGANRGRRARPSPPPCAATSAKFLAKRSARRYGGTRIGAPEREAMGRDRQGRRTEGRRSLLPPASLCPREPSLHHPFDTRRPSCPGIARTFSHRTAPPTAAENGQVKRSHQRCDSVRWRISPHSCGRTRSTGRYHRCRAVATDRPGTALQ